uniref:Uncharacterized protein n=1 Tax=Medicago truncatula TaxID=3880 RepID=Q2HSU4_MEDTR|nr:hypothetical protein MtrDRAFT_AC150891g32v2 [Medicago truncatula]
MQFKAREKFISLRKSTKFDDGIATKREVHGFLVSCNFCCDALTSRRTHQNLTVCFLQLFHPSYGCNFPEDPKILRNRFPMKALPGNHNPRQNPHETNFLRNYPQNPQLPAKLSQQPGLLQMDEQLAQMTKEMYVSHGLFLQRCQTIVPTETLCLMETVTIWREGLGEKEN